MPGWGKGIRAWYWLCYTPQTLECTVRILHLPQCLQETAITILGEGIPGLLILSALGLLKAKPSFPLLPQPCLLDTILEFLAEGATLSLCPPPTPSSYHTLDQSSERESIGSKITQPERQLLETQPHPSLCGFHLHSLPRPYSHTQSLINFIDIQKLGE